MWHFGPHDMLFLAAGTIKGVTDSPLVRDIAKTIVVAVLGAAIALYADSKVQARDLVYLQVKAKECSERLDKHLDNASAEAWELHSRLDDIKSMVSDVRERLRAVEVAENITGHKH